MADLIYIAVSILFFAICIAYTYLCERLWFHGKPCCGRSVDPFADLSLRVAHSSRKIL